MTEIKILSKKISNEITIFNDKFKDRSYSMETDGFRILRIETSDKEIIAYAKELGLKVE